MPNLLNIECFSQGTLSPEVSGIDGNFAARAKYENNKEPVQNTSNHKDSSNSDVGGNLENNLMTPTQYLAQNPGLNQGPQNAGQQNEKP